jgi:hypothetical protein
MRRLLLGLAPCVLLPVLSWAVAPAGGSAGSADEKLLRDHKIATDGPGLLDYFRKRTLGDAGLARINELVRQLGDDEFEVREKAAEGLVALGPRARSALQAALKDPDLEIRMRARQCLDKIDKGADEALRVSAAAVRVLARLRPAGAAGVLLGYLPSAEDESIAEEARLALAELAVRGGKVEPVLVAGLKDRLAVRRAAAAVALCRARAAAHFGAIRKLLADPDLEVRFRVGLALAEAREKESVPVLIALLDRLGPREYGRVEELLCRLTRDRSMPLPAGTDKEARRKQRQAWQAWWKEHGPGVSRDRVGEVARTLGFTVVVLRRSLELDEGQVIELDGAKRPRWQISGLRTPLDVQRLPGERVLVAEFGANRVTERTTTGEVVWEKKIAEPLAAQRLPNGNTFIATRQGLLEVDRTGKEVLVLSRPLGDFIMRARKLPNGDIALVTQLGTARFYRLDSTGRELKSFGVEVATSGGRIDLTPAGHVLVPERRNNRVVERDADGKVVREIPVVEPIAVTYLPNGHLLVTSMTQNRAVELDRSGKEVWEYRRTTPVTRAVRAY